MKVELSPDAEMRETIEGYLSFANGYYKILEGSLVHKTRFDNDLLYNIVAMCFEKHMITLLSIYNQFASNHVPVFLFKEARMVDSQLTDEMYKTVKLIGSFESICSMDGFGYHTPSDVELREMIVGMEPIHKLVNDRMREKIYAK
jgi:hypothetical protein